MSAGRHSLTSHDFPRQIATLVAIAIAGPASSNQLFTLACDLDPRERRLGGSHQPGDVVPLLDRPFPVFALILIERT